MDIIDLQWVTVLSLVALLIVLYLYLRQRSEIHNRNYLLRDEYYQVSSKPPPYMTRSFSGAPSNLPNLDSQDSYQRKLSNEINPSNLYPKNLNNLSGFVNTNASRLDATAKDVDMTRHTDKSFDEVRKYIPIDRSQEPSGFISTSKLDQTDNRPHWSKIEKSITQITTQPDDIYGNRDILLTQTQQQFSQDAPIAEDRWDNARNFDTKPLNDYADHLDNEYKVFKDFRLREGRSLHDEPKRDESPRPTNRMSALDRVGHSPDSPFRMFESPLTTANNSKKKMGANQTGGSRSIKPLQGLLTKKDSFSRTQQALNQKAKAPVRPVPHNQRSAKVLADQKNERKAKMNQVFIDNNSDDEMAIEEQKDLLGKNKRGAADTRSYDKYERETNSKKFLKGNDNQPKGRISEVKKPSLRDYEPEALPKKTQKSPLNKQSSVDLSYMTEYRKNQSLQKYVQMKTRQDETTKPHKPSTPASNTKAMNIEKSPRQGTASKTQDKANANPFKPPSSLARKEEPKKADTNGHAKTEMKEEKSIFQKPDNEVKKSLFEKKDEEKPALPSDTSIKPEGSKISSMLGGSSIFAQSTGRAQPKLISKPEEPAAIKPTEPEKPAIQAPAGGSFDLFRTIKAGGPPPALGELKDQAQPKATTEEDKKTETQEPKKPASLGLFSNTDNKKPEAEKPQEQTSKPEVKNLFGANTGTTSSGGGLFGSLSNANQGGFKLGQTENKPEASSDSNSGLGFLFNKGNEAKQTKETDAEVAKSNETDAKEEQKPKTLLFGSLGTANTGATGGSLFGNLSSSTKKEGEQPGFSSLFANANKDTSKDTASTDVKKEDPLAAYSKSPDATDDSKPKAGLFANLPTNTSGTFGSLFNNAGNNTTRSGGLFGGLSSAKNTGTGLFSNLNNNTNQPKECGNCGFEK